VLSVAELDAIDDPQNIGRLVDYLTRCGVLDGPIKTVHAERAGLGQSYENWLIEVHASAPQKFIVRREPASGPLEPYDVVREATLLEGLSSRGVPVPPVLALCTDEAVLARPFAVLGFVPGAIPDYRNIASTAAWADAAARQRMLASVVNVLAAIQNVDWRHPDFAGVASEPPGVSWLPARIRRMTSQLSTLLPDGSLELAAIADAGAWIVTQEALLPPTRLVLTHGDYRVGNLIWQDNTRIAAVIDWEQASVGDPMQDVGYLCHPMHRETHPELMGMLGRRSELFSLYEKATGWPVDVRRVHLYMIFALFFVAFTNTCLYLRTVGRVTSDIRVASNFPKAFRILQRLLTEIARYEAGDTFC
jgi:aminoglycoside phosphotransferase (APT) family kinase protein